MSNKEILPKDQPVKPTPPQSMSLSQKIKAPKPPYLENPGLLESIWKVILRKDKRQ